jgi:hypothetical protein
MDFAMIAVTAATNSAPINSASFFPSMTVFAPSRPKVFQRASSPEMVKISLA